MRLFQAAFYGLLATCYGGCFYFAIGLFLTLAQNGDIGKFLGDFIVTMIIGFGLMTFIIHEFMGMFDELNQRPRQSAENQNKNGDVGQNPDRTHVL